MYRITLRPNVPPLYHKYSYNPTPTSCPLKYQEPDSSTGPDKGRGRIEEG